MSDLVYEELVTSLTANCVNGLFCVLMADGCVLMAQLNPLAFLLSLLLSC